MPPVRRTISLNGTAPLMSAMMEAFVLIAPEMPFILQPFRVSEQFWIDHRRTDCGAGHPHGAAYRVEGGLNSPKPTPLQSNRQDLGQTQNCREQTHFGGGVTGGSKKMGARKRWRNSVGLAAKSIGLRRLPRASVRHARLLRRNDSDPSVAR